ncbi:TPA: pilS cassette, partial [Neisseria gonorrhoeae]
MSTVFIESIESIESALSTTRPYATEPSFPRKWESRTRGFSYF